MDLNNAAKWWTAKKEDKAKSVFAFVNYLDSEQSYRSQDNLKNARLYGNFDLAGLATYRYNNLHNNSPVNVQNRVTLNVIQSMIDTVVSKVTKSKPRPTFLTSGGNWSIQRKSKKLTKYIDGVFSCTEFYSKAAQAFLDSCIFGTGALKIYTSNGKIKVERVFIDEIKVDDTESFYSKPRQMHQEKYIQKDILKQMFPGNDAAIDASNDNGDRFANAQQSTASNMVKVIESWHLPSSMKAKDGRHTISIQNRTLLDEPYYKTYFPFVFYRWGLRPVGFFGQGLSEQLTGLQLEINKILRTIQISMHLVSVPKLLVEASSK